MVKRKIEVIMFKILVEKDKETNTYLITNNSLLEVSSSLCNKQLSRNLLRSFFELNKIDTKISPKIVQLFTDDFFEEMPKGNIKIPFEVINDWYNRLKFKKNIRNQNTEDFALENAQREAVPFI